MSDFAFNQWVEGQTSPHLTVNEMVDRLGNAMSRRTAYDLSAGNASVTAEQYRTYIIFRVYGISTSGRTLTLPAVERFAFVEADGANTHPVTVVVGSTTLEIAAGNSGIVYTDGTTNGLYLLSAGGGGGGGDITVSTQAGTAYTLALADAGSYVVFTAASAVTVTVPTNATVAYPVGTVITLNQAGTGQLTVAPAGGVTVNTTETYKSRARYSSITLIKRDVNTWDLTGDLQKIATPAFLVNMSANQNGVSAGIFTKVNFDTVVYDNGGYWNPATLEYAGPSGLYEFMAVIHVALIEDQTRIVGSLIGTPGGNLASNYESCSGTTNQNGQIGRTEKCNGATSYHIKCMVEGTTSKNFISTPAVTWWSGRKIGEVA